MTRVKSSVYTFIQKSKILWFLNYGEDENSPLNGSVRINTGASATDVPDVVLAINAENAAYIKVSNYRDGAIGYWENYTEQKFWKLPSRIIKGSTQRVYVQFMNSEGNVEPLVFDRIRCEYGREGRHQFPAVFSARYLDDTQITLTWENADSAKSYILKRSVNFFIIDEINHIVQPGVTSYTNQYIQENCTYLYRITACNSEGFSQELLSNRIYTTLLPPVDCIASRQEDCIVIFWTKLSQYEDEFIMGRKANNSPFIQSKTAESDFFSDMALSPNTNYQYRIRAHIFAQDLFLDYSNTTESIHIQDLSTVGGSQVTGIVPVANPINSIVSVDIIRDGFDLLSAVWLRESEMYRKDVYSFPDSIYDICVKGDSVYVGAGYHLYICDNLQPADPVISASVSTYGFKLLKDLVLSVTEIGSDLSLFTDMSVQFNESYAFVASYNSTFEGFSLFDIKNPHSPQKIRQMDLLTPLGLALKGNRAYVTNKMDLRIMDISNERSPQLLGAFNKLGRALKVTIDDQYAFIADGVCGLQVIDISNENQLNVAGFLDTEGYAEDIFIENEYAYIANGNSGILIVNISDPLKPKISC